MKKIKINLIWGGVGCSEITNAATKELNIESELKNVADVWRVQEFEVAKYVKDGVDKGWVLRTTEQITFLVEEMTLNLQGMTSSRFVRAFLDEVNSWAFKLGLIGEVMDIWMQVCTIQYPPCYVFLFFLILMIVHLKFWTSSLRSLL